MNRCLLIILSFMIMGVISASAQIMDVTEKPLEVDSNYYSNAVSLKQALDDLTSYKYADKKKEREFIKNYLLGKSVTFSNPIAKNYTFLADSIYLDKKGKQKSTTIEKTITVVTVPQRSRTIPGTEISSRYSNVFALYPINVFQQPLIIGSISEDDNTIDFTLPSKEKFPIYYSLDNKENISPRRRIKETYDEVYIGELTDLVEYTISYLPEGLELDSFYAHEQNRVANLQWEDYAFDEPIQNWLARYWKAPQYRDRIQGMKIFNPNKPLDESIGTISSIKIRENSYSGENVDLEITSNELGRIAISDVFFQNEVESLDKLLAGKSFVVYSPSYNRTTGKDEYFNEFTIKNVIISDKCEPTYNLRDDRTTYSTINTGKESLKQPTYRIIALTTDGRYYPVFTLWVPEFNNKEMEYNGRSAYTGFAKKSLDEMFKNLSGNQAFYPKDKITELIAMNDSIRKVRAIENEKERAERAARNAARKKELTSKYGAENASAIMSSKIIKGMNETTIKEAIGPYMKNVLKSEIKNDVVYTVVHYKGMFSGATVIMAKGQVLEVLSYEGLAELEELSNRLSQ